MTTLRGGVDLVRFAGYAALAEGTTQWQALAATVDRQLSGTVPTAPREGNPS